MGNHKDNSIFLTDHFQQYLIDIIHLWSKTLTTIGYTLVPIFFILDYFMMPPDLLPKFAAYRIIATVIVLIQYFILSNTRPSKLSLIHAYFTSFVVSLTIVFMTVDLGGLNSGYYAGLNLVIIAVNLLIPWAWYHSAINGCITIIMYIILNLLTPQPYSFSILIQNLYFLSSTVIIATSINYVRFKLIKEEFSLRAQLKTARDALWGEMEIAKRIQTTLLPNKEKIGNYEISTLMIPAAEVGGDYFDILETKAGEKWITIGDVSGHGVESGLIMMMTQTSLFSIINQKAGKKPSDVLNETNFIIKENISRLGGDHYMTISAIRLDVDKITVSGRHQDILVYRSHKGCVESFPIKGTWLGILNDIKNYLFDVDINIDKGDIVLLFTDGVTEAANANGELFGQERLEKALEKYSGLPLQGIISNIVREVADYQIEQEDDITLVIFKRT
jgi:serine phosphatase RsbU (regulator of sigma subunit)